MPRPKGLAKTGGRTKGSLNKDSFGLKAILDSNQCEPVTELLNLLPTLAPDHRAKVYLDLIQYLYPRRRAVETSVDQSLIDAVKNLEDKTTEELLAILKQ